MDRDRILRLAGLGATLCALIALLVGVVQLTSLPPEKPRPNTADEFMSGQITIGEVGRRNDEWFEASSRRSAATMSATAALTVGLLFGVVGLSLVVKSSRRLRRAAYADQELAAEAIARGLGRGFSDDNEGETAAIDSRLAKLETLHTRGLVTDDEYRDKRHAILAEL